MVEEKQNLTIACTATGQPKPKITWSKSVNKLPKDRNKVMNGALTIYHVVKKDGGTYICKADNILSSATDTAQLMVFSPLRFKVKPPKEVHTAIGYTVHLPCMAESDLRPVISWSKDGSILPVGSRVLKNNTLVLNNIKKSHRGSYTCRATNALKTIETEVKNQFSSEGYFLFCYQKERQQCERKLRHWSRWRRRSGTISYLLWYDN